jgi:glc operon protein GlcG
MDGQVYRTVRHVTYAAAAEAIQAGLSKATELGINVGIVVTDAIGEIVVSARMDGASPRAWKGGLGKASVAAGLGISTETFLEKRLKQDEVLWRAMSGNPDTFLVPGGVPLLVEGRSVGAVGVSGGHYGDDAKVAQAVADRYAELVAAASGK